MDTIYNPTGKSEHSLNVILQLAGILLHWAKTGNELGLGFKETFERSYPFGLQEMVGGKVDEEGIYTYPGDPPLIPQVKLLQDMGEVCYIYEYGIVVIVGTDGVQFVTRMD